MIRFIAVFVSLYSLMHALFYFRIRPLLPEGRFRLLTICFLALMVFAPIGTRLLERSDHYALARIAAHIGYSWMGYIFYGFCLSLVIGIAGVLLKLVNMAAGTALPELAGKKAALTIVLAALAICVYGLFEARSLRVERITIGTDKLPAGVDRLKIAQISDIHLGLLVGEETLQRILEKVRTEAPDILVSTGDLVDGDMDRIGSLPALFETINPPLGKFAVTGNHEVYVGLNLSVKASQTFGFDILRGESRNVGGIINLVGVDDPATGEPNNEGAVLRKAQNGLFTLLLKHRPDPAPDSLGLFDLQLSGHTHYGQLFPFRLASRLGYPLQNGPYYLEKGSILYTSRGTATWGPPFRVLAPPEVTIIEIVRK